ncbi:hypothetical protein RXR86_28715, partial [Pseudomonas aeruginosa]|nr:hypothetical protein [Pseudomonas aeruginosa]
MKDLHIVAEMMNNFTRAENEAYAKALKQTAKRLNQARMSYRVLQNVNEEINSDFLLVRRILHEIFADYPEIRIQYMHI